MRRSSGQIKIVTKIEIGAVKHNPHDITAKPEICLLSAALFVYPTAAQRQAMKSQKLPSIIFCEVFMRLSF